MNVREDRALSRDLTCALRDRSEALLLKILNSLSDVAVILDERLLAVHHACAGLVAKLFHHLC